MFGPSVAAGWLTGGWMDGCCGGHTYITHDKPTAKERMNERTHRTKATKNSAKIIQPTKTSRPLRMNRHKTDIRTERQTYSQLIVVVVVVGHPTYRYLGIESTTITIYNSNNTNANAATIRGGISICTVLARRHVVAI